MEKDTHHTQESKDLIRDKIIKLGVRSILTRKKIRKGLILYWQNKKFEELQKANNI
jgi:hypothetical protein